MFYIIKNINYDNIRIKYLYKKQIYKIYYDLYDNIDIIGIPISIKYKNVKLHYNLVYIYLDDVSVLDDINKIIYKFTETNIIKNDLETNKRYIVCKNTKNMNINCNNININISKIIKNNEKYVPLIYII